MRKISFSILALAAVMMSGTALAFSCPSDMSEIDEALASMPEISKSDLGKVKGLRAKGEAMHKNGKHAESIEALNAAKDILGI